MSFTMTKPLPPLGQWPELDWELWQPTANTLHMWTQIVGKTRLALTPIQNHWWNTPLYLSARGLTTSAMPIENGMLLDIEFDFIAHQLVFRTSSGRVVSFELRAVSVAQFYAEFLAALSSIAVNVTINPIPVELSNPIAFHLDTVHDSYDRDAVERFWRTLMIANTLFKRFSTGFYGKISPVHFFWGSFDLAVTRFNGKRSNRIITDRIQAEAYSHEVISAGFWPGNGGYGRAAFYSYAAPVPPTLSEAVIRGKGGFDRAIGEFILDYDAARTAAAPEETVIEFLNETYRAAAQAADWNRNDLDRAEKIMESTPPLSE